MKRQLRRANEVILVPTSHTTTAFTTGTTILTGNTTVATPGIDSVATGNFIFAEGNPLKTNYNQQALAATITSDKKRVLDLFVKTNYTGLKYPLKNLKFLSSTLNAEFDIRANLERYKRPTYSVWTMKNASTVYEPNSAYQLEFKFKGRNMDEAYSTEGLIYTATTTTPDFASGTSQTSLNNYVLNKLGIDILASSPVNFPVYRGRVPMVALAIAAGGSTQSGTTLTAINAAGAGGIVVNVWNSKRGLKTADFSQDQCLSIGKIIGTNGYLGTDKVVPFDDVIYSNMSLASSDALKGIIFVPIDRETAWEDFVAQTQNIIDNVGASKNFDPATVTIAKVDNASEQNSTKALWLLYRNTFSQRLYNKLFDERANINYPNPIDLTKKYMVLTIEHSNEHSADLGHLTIDPFKTMIICEEGDITANLATSSPTMNTIVAALDAFLAVNNLGATTL